MISMLPMSLTSDLESHGPTVFPMFDYAGVQRYFTRICYFGAFKLKPLEVKVIFYSPEFIMWVPNAKINSL